MQTSCLTGLKERQLLNFYMAHIMVAFEQIDMWEPKIKMQISGASVDFDFLK